MTSQPVALRTAPRDNLQRSVPFTITRATDDEANDDGLTLEGYAAVFGRETEINSWEGRFLESIAPGAFKKTIREQTPRLQFDHGSHPLIGSIPIGKVESLSEDDEGLHVEARLLDNWLVQPVREAIALRAIDGMSFRFSVVREDWTDDQGKKITDPDELAQLLWRPDPERGIPHRVLRELKVPELGPVVWPAYRETSVGVRSTGPVTIDLARLDQPEQLQLLAKALFIADAATARSDGGTPMDPMKDQVNHLPQNTIVKQDEVAPSDAPDGSSGDEVDAKVLPAPAPADHPSVPSTTSEADDRSQDPLVKAVRGLAEYVESIKKGSSSHGG